MDIKRLNGGELLRALERIAINKLDLKWGAYFKFLEKHKTIQMDGDVQITLNDKRKVIVMRSEVAEGNAGYMAFIYVKGGGNNYRLERVNVACKFTGRTVIVKPDGGSSTGIHSILKRTAPHLLGQYDELLLKL